MAEADTKTSSTEAVAPAGLDARWALPVVACAWLFVLGWLPVWAGHLGGGFPGWLMALGGLAVAGGGSWWARTEWTPRLFGYGMAEHGVGLALAVGVGVGYWLVRAAYSSPWQQLPVLLLGGAVAGAWWALLMRMAEARQLTPDGPAPTAVAGPSEDAAMRAMLDASYNTDVIIVARADTRAGQSWTLGPRTVAPDGTPLTDLPDAEDFLQNMPRLQAHLAAYWRARGVEFTDGDIRVERQTLDRWVLHINSTHVEREPVTAERRPPGARSWNMPQWLGLYLDGGDIEVTLRGRHMKVVGATGGGKSVIASNAMRAALTSMDTATGTRDAHTWVCASDKLVPFVWPWLRPFYDGRMSYPAIDWVAGQSPARVLRFLVKVLDLAQDRNDRLDVQTKWQASAGMPGVQVVVEEAKVLTCGAETILYRDEEWTASRLINRILAVARSAAINLVLLTQDGLYEGLGPYGDEMMRNLTVRAVTVTETDSDGYMNLPKLSGMGVDPTLLRDNTIYVQASIEDKQSRPLPGKAAHLDGEAIIAPLVVAEVAPHAPPAFGPEDLAVLGEAYAHRWDAEALPELARAVTRQGLTWRPYTGAVATAAERPTVARAEGGAQDGGHLSDEEAATMLRQWWTRRQAATGGDPDVDWDGALDVLLHGDDLGPADALRTEATAAEREPGMYGLPSEADMQQLERMAAGLAAEVADLPEAPAELAGEVPGAGLPEPAASVVREIAAMVEADPGLEWVATRQVCLEVEGTDDPVSAQRLGKRTAAVLAGLRSTDPRAYGGGKRGRGWMVADVRAAVATWRAANE